MKSILVFGCLLVGTLQACRSSPDGVHQPAATSESTIVNSTSTTTSEPTAQCSLEVDRFVHLADSVLSRAFSDPVRFSASTDTLSTNTSGPKPLQESVLTLTQNSTVCIHTRLIEANRKRGVRIDLRIACFSSDSMAEQCFSRLQYLGSRQSFKEDPVPGLTYQNDLVRLDGNRVLWISTSCLVSSSNHDALSEAFTLLSSIPSAAPKLTCRCGAVECFC